MNIPSALISLVVGAIALCAVACAGEEASQSDRQPAAQVQDDASRERARIREQQARERAARLRRIETDPPANEQSQPPSSGLEALRSNAASLAGVTADGVSIVSSERVTWSDGSLGCPRGDEMYTQMLVSGYRVVVSAGEQTFDYRLADSGFFRLCGSPASALTPLPGAADR